MWSSDRGHDCEGRDPQQSFSWGIFLREESAGGILTRGEGRWCSRRRKFSSGITVTGISAAWLPSNSQYPAGYSGPVNPCWISPAGALIPHGTFYTPDKTLSCSTRPLILDLISRIWISCFISKPTPILDTGTSSGTRLRSFLSDYPPISKFHQLCHIPPDSSFLLSILARSGAETVVTCTPCVCQQLSTACLDGWTLISCNLPYLHSSSSPRFPRAGKPGWCSPIKKKKKFIYQSRWDGNWALTSVLCVLAFREWIKVWAYPKSIFY